MRMIDIEESPGGRGDIVGQVLDADDHIRDVASGTLHYTVYRGNPDDDHRRCTMQFPIAASHFDQVRDEGLGFRIPVTFASSCEPLPEGELTYGLLTLELPDGRRIEDRKYSVVPECLGGTGEMNFPEHYERDSNPRVSPAERRREAFFHIAALLSSLSAEGAPPVGEPCAEGAAVGGRVLRVSRQMAQWIATNHERPGSASAPPVPHDMILAMNGFEALAATEFLRQGTPPTRQALDEALRPLGHAELVVVERFVEPTVTDSGATDRTGTFRPGEMVGEVWIVDLGGEHVLCRNAVRATSVESARGDRFDSNVTRLRQQFAGAVGRAITAASAEVAPGLRPTP